MGQRNSRSVYFRLRKSFPSAWLEPAAAPSKLGSHQYAATSPTRARTRSYSPSRPWHSHSPAPDCWSAASSWSHKQPTMTDTDRRRQDRWSTAPRELPQLDRMELLSDMHLQIELARSDSGCCCSRNR